MAEISDLKLAAIVAIASALGAIGVPLVSKFLPSVDARNQSSVQLIEIAVNVLSTTKPEGAKVFSADAIALREWSVEIINNAAAVKIEGAAKDSLINGQTTLPVVKLPLPSASLSAPWDRNNNKSDFTDEQLRDLFEGFRNSISEQE